MVRVPAVVRLEVEEIWVEGMMVIVAAAWHDGSDREGFEVGDGVGRCDSSFGGGG